MQMTIRNIPPEVRRRLEERAKAEGKSLNQVVIDDLSRAEGLPVEGVSGGKAKMDLSFLRVSEENVRETEAAIRDFDAIHPEDWK